MIFGYGFTKLRNTKHTSASTIVDQMNEPRPLPLGRSDFEAWAERIIAGALVPGGEDDKQAFIDSQKHCLAASLLHLGPTESHKPDAYFIHHLRTACTKQVAHAILTELNVKEKTRLAEIEAKMSEDQE